CRYPYRCDPVRQVVPGRSPAHTDVGVRQPFPGTVLAPSLPEDGHRLADVALPVGPRHARRQVDEAVNALLPDALIHLAGHLVRDRAAALGVREDVDAGERHLLAEGVALLELLVRLTREARNHVCGDRNVRDRLAQAGDGPTILVLGIAAAHALEHGLAAALEGEVVVPAEPRVLPETDEVVVQVLRLHRGHPDTRDRRLREQDRKSTRLN